jgi:hypothetical protein
VQAGTRSSKLDKLYATQRGRAGRRDHRDEPDDEAHADAVAAIARLHAAMPS